MKFGVREVADVMLKAKANGQKVGNKTFQKGQPVCHFDTLKTSTVEGAATTVYATGGKGNPRLIAWEGERTLTFTMEDALISPMGIAILTGAGLIVAGEEGAVIPQHTTEVVKLTAGEDGARIATVEEAVCLGLDGTTGNADDLAIWVCPVDEEGLPTGDFYAGTATDGTKAITVTGIEENYSYVMVDYYTKKESGLMQIDIEPSKFGGNYYLEASTLFRDQATGEDYPAEFILPNCRVQSNFTFTMAPTGDPSTFTFTVDAFPGVTKYDLSKKVLCAIQVFSGE